MADMNLRRQAPTTPRFFVATANAVRNAGDYIRIALARTDRYRLALVLLPALLWAANSNWLFNLPFSIDSWVYFGYFLNLSIYKSSWFPYLYYGSRLPWIFSGYLLHRFFEVVTAQYILHFGVYCVAIFAFYSLLRKAVGRRSALLTTVLFGCQPGFLLATGWDYVDGPGCASTLAALACAFRAGKSPAPRAWLFAVGLAAAAMVYTNLVLLLFFPGILAFYVFSKCHALDWQAARTAVHGTLWIGTSMLVITVILAFANHALDGTYLFYAPSFRYAAHTVGKANVWSKADLAWIPGAYWIVLPVIGVVTTIAFLTVGRVTHSLRWNDTRVLFSANYLACFGAMLVWELNRGYAFEYGFYVSYLLGPLFLAFGCQILGTRDIWSKTWFWATVTSVAILMAAPFRLIGRPIMTTRYPGLGYLVAVVAGAVAVRILWPRRRLSMFAVLLAFGWLQCILVPYSFAAPRSDNAAILRRIAESIQTVRARAAAERPLFWYNRSEEYGAELWAINASYLWGYTYVSYNFPQIVADHAPEPETLVVIPSALPLETVVSQAATALAPLHLNATVLSRADIGGRYFLTFIRIHDNPSDALQVAPAGDAGLKLVVGSERADGLPQDRWILCEYPTSRSSLTRTRNGVLITTASQHDAYGAKYVPLSVPQEGLYHFDLTYRLVRGGLLFGVMAGDESRWIAHGTSRSPDGQVSVASVTLHLKAGERIVLMTCNAASEASVYELLSLRARVNVDPPRIDLDPSRH